MEMEVDQQQSLEPQPSCSWHIQRQEPQPASNANEEPMPSPTDAPDWQSKYDSVTSRNAVLLNNHIWSDLNISFPTENVTIPAHRIIVAPASSVLADMIGQTVNGNYLIEIDDLSHNSFMEILRYIYTDFLQITMDNAISTMNAARKYKLHYLEEKCINTIAAEIKADNVCTYFNNCTEDNVIVERCLKLIRAETRPVLQSESFLTLTNEKMIKLLQIEGLNATEKDLYEAALKWAENACALSGVECSASNKRKMLNNGELLIRFPTMDINTFMECVQLDVDFFTKEEIGELNISIAIGKNESKFYGDKRNSFEKMVGNVHVACDQSSVIGNDYFYGQESDGFEIKPNCGIILKGFGVYGLLEPGRIKVTIEFTVFEPNVDQSRLLERSISCDGTQKVYPIMFDAPIEYNNCVFNTFIVQFDVEGKYYCNKNVGRFKDQYNIVTTKKYGDFQCHRIGEIYFETA